MRNLTWSAACGLALFLLCLGGVLGVAFPAHMARIAAPVLNRVMDSAQTLRPDALVFVALVLIKNCLVLFLVLTAGPSYDRLKGKFFRSRLAACLSRVTDFSVAFFPVLILLLNGAVLSWSVLLFARAGVPLAALLGGILPHGVFELAALVMVSALVFCRPGSDFKDRMAFFVRPIFPLLVVSALVEAYISPAIMVRLWS
ncbi:Stage II sporulation protein M [Neomoorella glycerini]|uniref:Stage II sporulation protein M n=1 Tax=Neomoorella glycerini TaxID=55779 RepID=A0A6I5ZTK8_9FIRM|nr:stage II sporulation protein M [Moorella glycerini]QGP93382.1 Stage II sporulation protein M [Moorella glycerini]